MRTVGIIAEYNPFHRGHAYQLQQAKALSDADFAVAVMSGCFTQRGDAAILPPSVRVEAALQSGADAVILLPACWSVRDAEHFALGGAALLQGIGVDAISFGAETDDLTLLMRAAELPDAPPALDALLAQGLPHPEALQRAWEAFDPDAAAVMRSPNNLLGVCYLRALKQLGAQLAVYPVARQGCSHNDTVAGELASSTAIREALRNGNWQAAASALPAEAFDAYRQAALRGQLTDSDALDTAYLYRLRTMTAAEFTVLPGAAEGLNDRLARSAGITSSRAALLESVKTRRYPYARLSRMATHALLQIDEQTLSADFLPTHAVLLGCRRDASPLLSRLSQGTLPLVTRRHDLPGEKSWLQVEERAWNIFALAAGLPSGMLYTEKLTRI